MTDNEIGYQIYLRDQKAYHFIPVKYNSVYDYTKYLTYYTDPAENIKLIDSIIKGS